MDEFFGDSVFKRHLEYGNESVSVEECTGKMDESINTSKLVFIMKEYEQVLCVDKIFNEHL